MLSEAKLARPLGCSQGLSRQMCTLGCPAKAASTEPEAGGAPAPLLATESKLGLCKAGPRPLPAERAGGPHITVLQRARSPHQLGEGQGPGAERHYLLPALLGSSITAGSAPCPALGGLGSSAQHGSPEARAARRLPQPAGLRQAPPGENAAAGAAAAPAALALVPAEWDPGLSPLGNRGPAEPLPGVHIAQLLAIASSWLVS